MSYAKKDDVISIEEMRYTRSQIFFSLFSLVLGSILNSLLALLRFSASRARAVNSSLHLKTRLVDYNTIARKISS